MFKTKKIIWRVKGITKKNFKNRKNFEELKNLKWKIKFKSHVENN